jgi:hypothetical protein
VGSLCQRLNFGWERTSFMWALVLSTSPGIFSILILGPDRQRLLINAPFLLPESLTSPAPSVSPARFSPLPLLSLIRFDQVNYASTFLPKSENHPRPPGGNEMFGFVYSSKTHKHYFYAFVWDF